MAAACRGDTGEAGSHPVFSVDRGIKDQLLDHNRRFHEHLEGLKIEHH